MKFHLFPIFTLHTLVLVVTNAALPPEIYWKSKLPTTPMPKAITNLLHPDLMEDKSTSVGVGNGGVNVDTGKGYPGGGTDVNVGGASGGVSVSAGHKGKPVYVGVGDPFQYVYAASETQLHDDPNVALFFLEKDMRPGTKLNLHFTKSANAALFLPRQVAKMIPFSSSKVPEILNRFTVKPGSMDSQTMEYTIKECEDPGIRGEEKYCATSLESMVDFTTSKLGKNVQALSTEVNKETQLQKYTIAGEVKKMAGDKAIVCHKKKYPYAVFYCHKTEMTRVYSVPLENADVGSRVKAVAICHTDTSEWNPKHLAFQVLKVKPGSVPVCHFLPEDHLVWVPK